MSDTAKAIEGLSPKKRELLELLYNERKSQGATRTRRIPRREDRDRFPLSFAQQRLLLIDKLEPGTPAYHIPLTRRITGRLDVEALERSMGEIINRHEVLRSTFSYEQGQPVGRVLPYTPFKLGVIDLRDYPEDERDERARQLAYEEARRPFDLSTGPLIRVVLLKLADEDHVVLLSMHHIISDAWSLGVFVKEMAALYGAFIKGWRSPLPDLPIQYSDYAEWQRGWLRGEVLDERLSYWRKRLAAAPPALELPATKPRQSAQTYDGATISFKIPDPLYGAVNALSKRENVTPFMILLAAFQTLLGRYTGKQDIIVGSPIANRDLPEVEPLIGFFVNTIVLRANLSGDPTFRELLARTREDCLGAFQHQDLPFEKIIQELQPGRGKGSSQMFRTMFSVQNVPMPALQLEGLTVTPFESNYKYSMFDMTFTLNERADLAGNGETQLIADLEYNTALFDADYMVTLFDRYQALLEAAVANPERRISRLPFLEEEAQKGLVALPDESEKARKAERDDEGATALPLMSVSRDEDLPLSFAQQRAWSLDQLPQGGRADNVPGALRLFGQLNLAALERGLNEIVRRHESLRTIFVAANGQPKQVITPERPLQLSKVDLTVFPEDEREARALTLAGEAAALPFDLAKGPLVRASLLRLHEREHILSLVMHRAVSDEWSLNVIAYELGSLYEATCSGGPAPLAPVAIQYADFASWQRRRLEGDALSEQLSYWRRQLSDFPVLQLGTDLARPAVQSLRGAKQPVIISRQLSDDLKAIGERNDATLLMTLMAAFKVLMYRYTGQQDVVTGTPIAGRDGAELEGLIGPFVNTLPVRVRLSDKASFRECLAQVRDACLEAYAHRELPFEKLAQELQPERDLSRNPVCQVAVSLRTPPQALSGPYLTIVPMEVDAPGFKYDLALEVVESQEGLTASLRYAADLFESPTIARMAGDFQTLLESIAADLDGRISDLALLPEPERQEILFGWNDTDREYTDAACIHLLFEQQAERSPNAVAVAFEQAELTYSELNSRANQLAHYLRSLGVGPDVPVGLCMERSLEMMVGILGIIKAGGAYVPLDPDYPAERLATMLKDANAPVLLTQRRLAKATPGYDVRVLCLDSEWETVAGESEENPVNNVTGDNLVYVIYTSGSTGTPKGVMVQHRSLVSYAETCSVTYGVKPGDRVLQFCSISFDISGEEIYPCLTRGATLVLRTDSMLNSIQVFLQRCREWKISVMSLPTAYWHQVAATLEKENLSLPPSLRLVVIAGERAMPERLAAWQKRAGQARLIHTYGPTEATISVTMCDISDFEVREGLTRELPIGSAIADGKIYVLDSNLQPVPVGVQGEVYIGGSLLARGYHKRPDVTAETFIPNPYALKPGERIYKSGDLARYLPGGNLEFLGRVDQQVKIRGFRIELEEVETVLRQHRAVREAVVLAQEIGAGNKRLVGFVVPDRGHVETDGQAAGGELQSKQTSHWREIFNNLYRDLDPNEELGFYIKGWTSSYSDVPIPSEEVREWMDQTVERVLSLRPTRVYEIGSGGSGLMLQRVAPSCEKYYATDQAERSLELIQEQLKILGLDLPQVTFKLRPGDNFQGVGEGEFDTVLIVSVAQYFPSVDYLMRVMEQAVKAVAHGGHIFLGDVRSLPLLEAFHASVQLHKSPPRLSSKELQQRVHAQLLKEKQLVIDPEFFIALKHHLPQISHVEIPLMRGRNRNELSKFRYDVILHVGGNEPAGRKIDWLDWEAEGLTPAAVRQLLQSEGPEILAIKGVPNARIAADVKLVQMLRQPDGPETAAELMQEYAAASKEGIDPEELWALGDQEPYAVNISWSESRADGRYDVVFQRRGAEAGEAEVRAIAPPANENITLRPWVKYATAPIEGAQIEKMGPVLRAYLEEKLPEYMVPSTFVWLDRLPLTPNGKVDRKALPQPERRSAEMESAYMAPRTELEKTISSIWQEVLGVERVGVGDNFFDLGGHSLFMAEIFAKLQSVVNKSFTMVELYEYPTVASLANYLSRDRAERSSFQQSRQMAEKSKDGKSRLKQQFRQRQAGKKR
jgi:amino acid adenylation domain-containing protein